MNSLPWTSIGTLLCAVAIGAGAFGAHGLKSRLEPSSLELWETAARYLIYGGLGLCLLGLAEERWQRAATAPGWMLLIGTMVFAGTVGALALGGPRWLGAVTPLGGSAMIIGFLVFSWRALGS